MSRSPTTTRVRHLAVPGISLALALVLGTAALAAVDEATTMPDPLAMVREAEASFDEGNAVVATDAPRAAVLFERSAALYEQVAGSGVDNALLWFNLGNAYAQASENPRAIGAYLNALRLAPGTAAVAHNLAHVRNTLGEYAAPQPDWLDGAAGLWQQIGLGTRETISLVAWISFWCLAAAGLLHGWSARTSWRATLAASAAVFVLSGTTVAIDLTRQYLHPPGVTLPGEVIARKGNGEGFTPAFERPLASGTEFQLLEERPVWLNVELADGKSGWIRAADALVAR